VDATKGHQLSVGAHLRDPRTCTTIRSATRARPRTAVRQRACRRARWPAGRVRLPTVRA